MSRTERSGQIAITGNKVDDEIYLLNHVRPLFQNIFGLELTSRYRHGENTMDLYRYSKEVALTLHSWGMPIGRKKLARLTPATPLEEVSFVRGLFDTDGCVYCKYGPYMQIQFKLANHDLLTYVKECLERLGFHPTSIRSDDTKFRFFLSRQTEVNRFFKVVEPRNPKHHMRFEVLHVHNCSDITSIVWNRERNPTSRPKLIGTLRRRHARWGNRASPLRLGP